MFWSSKKRWRFILNCAGIDNRGCALDFDVNELFKSIDKVSIEEAIEVNWLDIVRKNLRKFMLVEIIQLLDY